MRRLLRLVSLGWMMQCGGTATYEATITRTSRGVPHIVAEDEGSAAFGLGYAFAKDHACLLIEQVHMVRGERSAWFGAGPDGRWIDRDAGWRALGAAALAEEAWPLVTEATRTAIDGYVSGFDAYLNDHGAPAPCSDAPWVRPLTRTDVLTWAIALTLDGSGALFAEDIGRATPPSAAAAGRKPPGTERLDQLRRHLREAHKGSNGWALGGDRVEGGVGALWSNTHFPSFGEKQWYEMHLTVPGSLDVYGASLMGVPLVNLGFNHDIAWTHTVSYAPRFVAYGLTLDPADPTRYQTAEGGYEAMTPTTHRIEVLGDDGVRTTVSRTTWRSRFGPVLDAPVVGWTPQLAITFRDANARDLTIFDAWNGLDHATSLDDAEAALRDTQGIPWVYTLAAAADGEVLFADASRVPDLSEAALSDWDALRSSGTFLGFLSAQFADAGAILLDGSDPDGIWQIDPASAEPGLIAWDRAPRLRTRDYVANANDSHGLANATAPLTGFPALYGAEPGVVSARTKMNHRLITEPAGPDAASGTDGRFSLAEIEAAGFSMRSWHAEQLRQAIVARCTGVAFVLDGGVERPLGPACAVLAGWDGTFRADAQGAVLWRALLAHGGWDRDALVDSGDGLYATPYDPSRPIDTPEGLIPPPVSGTDPVLLGLARAAAWLAPWVDPAAPAEAWPTLGALQRLHLEDGTDWPVPGGQYGEGTIGIAEWWAEGSQSLLVDANRTPIDDPITSAGADGWWMNDGNSFMLAVTWVDGAPVARARLLYGQSDDPTSPHVSDQASDYATGGLFPVAFSPEDIAADTVSTETVRGRSVGTPPKR
jgi:acyl-homoserine-lactone acylase